MVYFKEMNNAAIVEFEKFLTRFTSLQNPIEDWTPQDQKIAINWMLKNHYIGMKEALGVDANSQIIRDSITFNWNNHLKSTII